MKKEMKTPNLEITLAEMSKDVVYLRQKVDEMNGKLEREYITKTEAELRITQLEKDLGQIQKIVYGVVSAILLSIVGGIVTFYINSPK